MYDESRFPLNRIIAFGGPYISIASGAAASWLLVHVHVLGLFHIQHDGLSTAIAQATVFLATALLAWAGQSKWLNGHHIMLAEAAATAAAFVPGGGTPAPEAQPSVTDTGELPPAPTDVHPEPGDLERLQAVGGAAALSEEFPEAGPAGGTDSPVPIAPDDQLPSDEEEFGAYYEPEPDVAEFPDNSGVSDLPGSRTRPDAPEEL